MENIKKKEKLTDTIAILSGPVVEGYRYKEKKIIYDYVIPEHYRKRRNKKIVVVDEASRLRKIESRKKGMRRARTKFRRLVSANAGRWKKPNGEFYPPIFITLTFSENIQDTKTANAMFSKFIKRLTYFIGVEKKTFLKYVVITEFQDRGAIHYHVIFFNLKFVEFHIFGEIWNQGFVYMNKIDGITNVGAYVCKYMCKEFEDERMDGKKRYFSSRGLKKPIVIKDQEEARRILAMIPNESMTYQSEFGGYMGKVAYTQWQVENVARLEDIISEVEEFPSL